MRDRIISAMAVIDEVDLRREFIFHGDVKCWGKTSWDPRGWELPPEFVDKWWLIIDEDIVEATNFWRRQRGEKALQWKGKRAIPDQRHTLDGNSYSPN